MRDDLDLVDAADAIMAALAVDYMANEVVASPESYRMFFGPWTPDQASTVETLVNRIFAETDDIRYDCWGVEPECERAWAAMDLDTGILYLCGGFWTDAPFEDDVELSDQRTTILHELSHVAGTENIVDSLDLDVPAPGWIDVSAFAQAHSAEAVTWAESYEYFYARLWQVKRARARDQGCDCHIGSTGRPGGAFVFSLLCGIILLSRRRIRPMRSSRLLLVVSAFAIVTIVALLIVRSTATHEEEAADSKLATAAPAMGGQAPANSTAAAPAIPMQRMSASPAAPNIEVATTKDAIWPAGKPWPAWLPKAPPEIASAARPDDPAAGTMLAHPVDMGLRGRLSVVGTPSVRELRVRLEVTNTGARPLMFAVAGTLFDSPNFKGISITSADGHAPPWVNDHWQVRRSPAGATDYLAIGPGETLTAERDLARYWTLPAAGRIHIATRDWLADAFEGNVFDARRQPWHTKVSLPANELDVSLSP